MENFIKEFITYNISRIIFYPDRFDVRCTLSTKRIIVEVKVDKSDIGKVVGRGGQMIDSLTRITSSAKIIKFPEDSRKIIIEVLENEDFRTSINAN